MERFFAIGLLEQFSKEQRGQITEFISVNAEETLRIARGNPDIHVVLFMGRFATHGLFDTFKTNVTVAKELIKILPKSVTMIANTRHRETDDELGKIGCQVMGSHIEVITWLKKSIR